MRRLFICTMIGALAWYLLRSFDLVAMVNISEFVPSDAKPYADAILLGVYTLLIILVAPAIHLKAPAVTVTPTKVDLNVMDFDPKQIVELVQRLHIKDPDNVIPQMVIKLAQIKTVFEAVSELDENYDLDGISEAASNIGIAATGLTKLANLQIPHINGGLKELHDAMDEINGITEEHDIGERAEQAEQLAEFATQLDKLRH